MSSKYDSWQNGWEPEADNAPEEAISAADQAKAPADVRHLVEMLNAHGVPASIDSNGDMTTPLSKEMFQEVIAKIAAMKSNDRSADHRSVTSQPIVTQGPNGEISIERIRTNTQSEKFVIDPGEHQLDANAAIFALGGVSSRAWGLEPSEPEYYAQPQDYGVQYQGANPYYSHQQRYIEDQPASRHNDEAAMYSAAEAAGMSGVQTPTALDETEVLAPQQPAKLPSSAPPVARVPRKPRNNVEKLDIMLDEDGDQVVEGRILEQDDDIDKSNRKSRSTKLVVGLASAALVTSAYFGYSNGYEAVAGEAPTKASLVYVVPVLKDLMP